MKIAGVIPARYGSTRFPGKPLALLDGRPMIVHVCERAAGARLLDAVWVATDDERIAAAVREAGFEARLTPSECATGSDRIVASLKNAECGMRNAESKTEESPVGDGLPHSNVVCGMQNEAFDIIVNIQGDEPYIDPGVIDSVAQALVDAPGCDVATAAVPIVDRADFDSPHVVKVVLRPDGRALYFSRSPLPSPARLSPDAIATPDFEWGLKHLGLYAYRRPILEAYSTWPQTPLERRESLEQLRFLERGVGIQIAIVAHDSIGVDTPEELEKLNQRIAASGAVTRPT